MGETMTQGPYILAHDLGTTGNKATLFAAESGEAVATVFEGYGTTYAQPNWAEQDPADWQRALYQGTRRLLAKAAVAPAAIAAISFSGQMQGAVLVDVAGRPLRPAVIWADQRATAQAERIRQVCGAEAIYRLTGHRVSPAYTAAKVLWIKEHQPEVYRRAHRVLQAKDYAAFLLTGRFATDHSDASGTQVFDLAGRAWAGDVLDALGLERHLWPEAQPSTTVIGRVTAEAASASGLVAGTPVVIGGGDGACATVGAAAVQAGDVYTYIGSSAWIAVTMREPIIDPQQRIFNFAHLAPGYCFGVGTMQAAGGAYNWLAQILQGEATLRALDAQAATAPVGAGGVLFLPYLLGERSPYWNPLARGAFVGLSMSHGRAEVARAVLEGVAMNLGLILDILREQGVQADAMRLIGGGARSSLWRQIVADVYGLPILLPALSAEATSLGAAIAGGVGVGLFPSFDIAKQFIPAAEAEQPEPARGRRYRALKALFCEAYAALEPVFGQLASMRE
jgi:xylulokinase